MSSNNRHQSNYKRKPHWQHKNKGAKRFNYEREENSSNRQWGDPEYDIPYNPRNDYRRGRFQNRTSRGYDRPVNLPSLFDYPQHLNQPPLERDLEIAESSVLENERREKILATKRRIEEALASTNPSSQDINLKESQEILENLNNKSSENNACVKEGAGLRLTNSDFKEIGSVESGVAVEPESSEMMLNISPHVAQKRSFDNTPVSAQIVPSSAKSRVEGWTMSSAHEVVTQAHQKHQESPNTPSSNSKQWLAGSGWNMTTLRNSDPETLPVQTRKSAGDLFLQESREEILGQIDPPSRNERVNRPPPKPSQPRRDFTNVGNLYQSFLRTRLFGYTYRQRNETAKPSGPNPLLDKSVLENQNHSQETSQQNTILELQMPRPILIKSELHDAVSTECIEQEASEFCKEFSYLLTDPNLLIPSENLEKLGLGHLSEMNDLVSKRSDEMLTNLAGEKEKVFQMRSLNSNSGKDLSMEPTAGSSTSNINSFNSNPHRLNLHSNEARESVQKSSPLNTPKFNGEINNTTSMSEQGVTVNSIADKVVEKLFNTLNKSTNNQQLNVQTLLQRQAANSIKENQVTQETSSGSQSSDTVKTPPNLVQTISGFILKIFLIDKQIEELSQEKMKIYSELLSLKDISSSLFNSWAQEQISKSKVVNCQTNQSNVMPQLMRLNQITNSNDFLQALVTDHFQDKECPGSPETTNDEKASVSLSSFDQFNPSCSTPPIPKTPEIIKPKLSVRKDLHDCNVPNSTQEQGIEPLGNEASSSPVSTLIEQSDEFTSEIPKEPCFVKVEGVPTDFNSFVSEGSSGHMNPVNKQENGEEESLLKKKSKKKKAKKKKDRVMEVVELLDSTDDESESVVSFEARDPLETEEPKQNEQSPTVKKSPTQKQYLSSIKYTPTCMEIFKAQCVLVGTKEGYLMVFDASNGQQRFEKEVHKDWITSLVGYRQRFVITGSMDCTVSVLSVKKKETILSFPINAPIQCCWLRSKDIFFGTKTGMLGLYNLMTNGEGLIIQEAQVKLKLTNCSIVALATFNKNCNQNEIVVASRGETVTIRDIHSGDVLHELDWCDTVTSLAVHRDIVYCGTNNRSIKGVNCVTRKNVQDCIVGRCVLAMAQMPNSSVLFAACKDNNIYAFNVQEGKLIATIPTSNNSMILSIAIFGYSILVIYSNSLQSIEMPSELINHIKDRRRPNQTS